MEATRLGAQSIEEEGDQSVREVLEALKRQKWFILAGALLGAAGWGVLDWLEEPEYESTVMMAAEDVSDAGAIEPQAIEQVMGSGGEETTATYRQMLRSQSLLGEVVDEAGLRITPLTRGVGDLSIRGVEIEGERVSDTIAVTLGRHGWAVGSGPDGEETEVGYGEEVRLGEVAFRISEPPEGAPLDVELEVLPRQRAIERLSEALRVRAVDGTEILFIDYRASAPARAAEVVNMVATRFQRSLTESSREEASLRSEFVATQLARTDSLLTEAQNELSDFRRQEQVFSSRERFIAQQGAALEMELERDELTSEREAYQSLLATLEETPEDGGGESVQAILSVPSLSENPAIGALFEQLVEYRSEYDQETSGDYRASADDPRVRQLQELISETEQQIADAVRSQITAMGTQIEQMNQRIAEGEGQIDQLTDAEAEELRLSRRVETLSGMADRLREEAQRAEIAEAVDRGPVRIVDPGEEPLDPAPNYALIKLGVLILLGGGLGGGVGYLWERTRTAIRHQGDMEATLGVPDLGVTPALETERHRGRRIKAASKGHGGTKTAKPARIGKVAEGRPKDFVGVAFEGDAPGVESFRALGTQLLYAGLVNEAGILAITSPFEKEGKTTTSSHLAAALAELGQRVLLIDGDLKRQGLSKRFEQGERKGVADLLDTGASAWREHLLETDIPGLLFLAGGEREPDLGQLRTGGALRTLLQEASESFDLVIIDTPPVLMTAEAMATAAHSDAVLMVVRAGSTEREAAKRAVRDIERVGGRIVGAVLNDPDGSCARYGSDYAYRYGYE